MPPLALYPEPLITGVAIGPLRNLISPLNASTELMSGLGAPARTSTPVPERTMFDPVFSLDPYQDSCRLASSSTAESVWARSSPQFCQTFSRTLSRHAAAERALIGADAGFQRIGRQLLITVLTGRSEFKHTATPCRSSE